MDKNTITPPQEIREAVRQYVINNYETYEVLNWELIGKYNVKG